jgi:hypothetical protein
MTDTLLLNKKNPSTIAWQKVDLEKHLVFSTKQTLNYDQYSVKLEFQNDTKTEKLGFEFQTPKLSMPFGINERGQGKNGMTEFKTEAQFDGLVYNDQVQDYIPKDLQWDLEKNCLMDNETAFTPEQKEQFEMWKFYRFIQKFEDKVLHMAAEKVKSDNNDNDFWFKPIPKKKDKKLFENNEDYVNSMYFSMLKIDEQHKYPPKIKIKFPNDSRNGKILTRLWRKLDQNRPEEPIELQEPKDIHYEIRSYSKGVFVIQSFGIWFNSGNFGVSIRAKTFLQLEQGQAGSSINESGVDLSSIVNLPPLPQSGISVAPNVVIEERSLKRVKVEQ